MAFLCGGLAACHQRTQGRPDGFTGRVDRRVLEDCGLALVLVAMAVVMPAAAAEWPLADGARAAREGDIAGADEDFKRAYSLRPWDSDTSMLGSPGLCRTGH